MQTPATVPFALLLGLATLAPAACALGTPAGSAAVVSGRADGATSPGLGPVELGSVAWQRDLDAALASAREQSKPVFALFQEIPGCATCRSFGQGPLSHPLLVEAIEELFVPVAILNNRSGSDAKILSRYGEPAWNNPVVRFLDAAGADLIARRDGVWDTAGIAARTQAALEASGRTAPAYLTLLAAEAQPLERATFSMFCYWEGEAQFGALDGVVATRAAWAGGKEVVEVTYDPAVISSASLRSQAEAKSCRPQDSGRSRDAKASDRKYYLRRSPLRLLALTRTQQAKINADLRFGRGPERWLSPRQVTQLAAIKRLLASEPERLAGLQAPEAADELGAYAAELEHRLAG